MKWQSIDDTDPWLRLGIPTQSSSFFGDLDGKYLFFSPDQALLMRIMENEISMHGFEVAKVSGEPRGGEHVACLYYGTDSRKFELAQRHARTPKLKYRYYKKNSDTRAGKYSKQYLESR